MKNLHVIVFFLYGLLPISSHAQKYLSHWYKPQTLPKKGPWFDGWYTRFYDHSQNLTFAVISTSYELERVDLGTVLKAHLTLMIQEPGSSRLQVEEVFSDQARMTTYPINFFWSSPDLGFVSHKETQVELKKSNISLSSRMIQFIPAYKDTLLDWGPMGIAQYFEFLPTHWFVATTGSNVTYKLNWKGKIYQGDAIAHTEKNWGPSFPKAWVWSQGFSSDLKSQYAVSGGPVQLGPKEFFPFLFVYRSEKVKFDIAPGENFLVNFNPTINPCEKSFDLKATDGRYRVQIKTKAPKNSFGFLSVPSPNGYLMNAAAESFLAETIIEIYKCNGQRCLSLVEKKTFPNAALEFGLGLLKCKK